MLLTYYEDDEGEEHRRTIEQENEQLRMTAVRKDLDSCYTAMQQRELDLQERMNILARQAVRYKQVHFFHVNQSFFWA